MLLHDLVVTSAAVANASSRLAKIGELATLLRRLSPEEVEIAIAFLSGEPRQGRIGIGPSATRDARPPAGAASPALQLIEVDEVFGRIAAQAGRGSPADRVRMLRELLARATGDEQDFLIRLLFGELRQGALEAVLLEAVARAANVSPGAVRRAVMMAGELTPVALAVLVEGESGLARFAVRIFRPVQPMLAQTASGIDEALADLEEDVTLEWKLDGARIQVHKAGD
ncbi:MAG TPA: hypothetical protein VKC15_10780, partial [Gemmatimonadales bacterium]|nr:hypothetical protein [Gemmatimonadales bacterium]